MSLLLSLLLYPVLLFAIVVSFLLLSDNHARREALGLPLIESTPNCHGLLEDAQDDFNNLERREGVILKARRGGRGGSRPSRPRPQRHQRPKPSPRPSSKPKPPNSRKPKPSSKKSTSSKVSKKPTSSKATKNVWPKPAVPYLTAAINPCNRWIDCTDEGSFDLIARGVNITATPEPTVTPEASLDKRDVRTQKPVISAMTLVIKNLGYPEFITEAELGNAEHFFGVKLPTDLAVEWNSFIRVHLASTGTTAQSWARAQIGVAQNMIKKEITNLEGKKRRLNALEKKNDKKYRNKVNADYNRLATEMAAQKRQVAAHNRRIQALRQAAQSQANLTSLGAEIKAKEKVELKYNLAERKRAMLREDCDQAEDVHAIGCACVASGVERASTKSLLHALEITREQRVSPVRKTLHRPSGRFAGTTSGSIGIAKDKRKLVLVGIDKIRRVSVALSRLKIGSKKDLRFY
ncbi:hypothetical protein BU23DRAFT_569242 [Bimuria novae-zelandiae CBS 107.79]|uniref:Uncharacterized protein n=1 Tax=Bimuria novae-zelandiae CBS 107.79 TaxID=1447943 RepID=A0A6A5V6F6_9PLEO|nr:hypothetical protein BU23DRAFT_569242 [Bimuria novae-zelandiae CBS 107.79]